MKKILLTLLAAVGAAASFSAHADVIPTSSWNVTGLQGTWAYGTTDWNFGEAVNNVADVAQVNAMMKDGYVAHPQSYDSPVTGIFNYRTPGFHALEVTLGADTAMGSFTFWNTRSDSPTTPIGLDYRLNGGAWINVMSSTSGALGLLEGPGLEIITISMAGILADQIRLTTNGGNQISVHELVLSDADVVAHVPEPASIALFGLGLAAVGGIRRKRRR